MMSVLHLLWIIPVAASVGAVIMGVLVGGNRSTN